MHILICIGVGGASERERETDEKKSKRSRRVYVCVCASGGRRELKEEKPERGSGWEERERESIDFRIPFSHVALYAAAARSPWIGHLQDRAVVQERSATV